MPYTEVTPSTLNLNLMTENIFKTTTKAENDLYLITDSIMQITEGGTGANTVTGIINNLKDGLKSFLLETTCGIGSYYISENNTSPAGIIGGTWERIKDKFLLAAGDIYNAGLTGGSATVTLTEAQLAAHTHTFTGTSVTISSSGAHTHKAETTTSGANTDGYVFTGGYTKTATPTITTSSGAHTHTFTAAGTNSTVGSGAAHDNMPPYLTVYVWKRIA